MCLNILNTIENKNVILNIHHWTIFILIFIYRSVWIYYIFIIVDSYFSNKLLYIYCVLYLLLFYLFYIYLYKYFLFIFSNICWEKCFI